MVQHEEFSLFNCNMASMGYMRSVHTVGLRLGVWTLKMWPAAMHVRVMQPKKEATQYTVHPFHAPLERGNLDL